MTTSTPCSDALEKERAADQQPGHVAGQGRLRLCYSPLSINGQGHGFNRSRRHTSVRQRGRMSEERALIGCEGTMTHRNALLIEQLFAALDRHDPDAMAACYSDDKVRFHDIAFHIQDKARLHGMWRMICEGESGIRVTVKGIAANDQDGEARIVDPINLAETQTEGRKGTRSSTRSRRVSDFATG